MALVLKFTVPKSNCPGTCCKRYPRFPNKEGTDCIYHKVPDGRYSSGCMLMTGEKTLPNENIKSKLFPKLTNKELFDRDCIGWPANQRYPRVAPPTGKPQGDFGFGLNLFSSTGDCCQQWVEE